MRCARPCDGCYDYCCYDCCWNGVRWHANRGANYWLGNGCGSQYCGSMTFWSCVVFPALPAVHFRLFRD
jgi:hypothetical protein